MEIGLQSAYAYCEAFIAHHSSSFYQAFNLLPARERRAVFAVYGFCRKIDDVVDDETKVRDVRLNQYRQISNLLTSAMNGNWAEDDPVFVALQDVFSTYEMDFAPFFEMLDGQWCDLHFTSFETMEQLERYCYLVAGSVGLMLLPILTPEFDDDMREEAAHLGIAMQLSNVLRDVREDYERQRVYLPTQLLQTFPRAMDAITSGQVNDDWRMLASFIIHQGRQSYEKGMASYHRYPVSSRVPLLAAGKIYGAIFDEIEQRDYDVFSERVFVSDVRKLTLLGEIRQMLDVSPETPQGANA